MADKASPAKTPAVKKPNAFNQFFKDLGQKVSASTAQSNRRVAQGFNTLIRGKSVGGESDSSADVTQLAQAALDEGDPALGDDDARASAEEVLASMEPGFFEKDHPAVRLVLERLPGVLAREQLEDLVISRMSELDAVNARLTVQVGEHYADFVQGMAIVSEVDRELQFAHVIAKNGRRYLAAAAEEVHSNLRIAGNTRQKGHLLEVLELLERLQAVLRLKATFRASLDKGAFPAAIGACVACAASLDELGGLECAVEVRAVIDEALAETLERTDAALKSVCAAFSPAPYLPVYEAYLELGDAGAGGQQLGDKAAGFLSHELLAATQAVLRAAVSKSRLGAEAAEIAAMRGMMYPELAGQLDASGLRGCLRSTLELLFALMASHHAMVEWHRTRGETLAAAAAAADAEAAPPANTAGATTSAPSTAADGPEPLTQFARVFEAAGESAERRAVAERALCTRVADALDRGKRTVWDLAARRLAALLAVPAAADATHFMSVLEWCHLAARAGEAFSGAEAAVLRQTLARTAARYFEGLHASALDTLRKALNKEPWRLQPPPPGSPELRVALAAAPPPPGSIDPPPPAGAMPMPPLPPGAHPFEAWLARGNPFMDDKPKKAVAAKKGVKVAKGAAPASVDVPATPDLAEGGEPSPAPSPTPAPAAPSATHGDPPQCATASSLAVLSTMAKYLALLKQLGPGAAPVVFQGLCQLFECYLLYIFRTFGKTGALATGEGLTPRLRATLQRLSAPGAGSIAAFAEGASAMEFPEDDAAAAAAAAAAMAGAGHGGGDGGHGGGTPGAAGHPGEVGGVGGGGPKAPAGANKFATWMQARGAALKTGFETLGTNISHTATTAVGAVGAVGGVVGGAVGGAAASVGGAASSVATSGAAAVLNVVSSNNLYGLRERYVASESLWAVAEQLRALRPTLAAVVPTSAGLDDFYKRTVESVGDLREHLYRANALLLLRLDGLPDRLAGARWDVKDMPAPGAHSRWVDDALMELRQYKAKLGCVELVDDVQRMLWEFALTAVGDAIVDGMSRVKRCTNEGRGAMAMDVQVLLAEMGALAPRGAPKPNLRHVEAYIKAFYVPEGDMLHWAQTHREYSPKQLLALVRLVADTNKWRKDNVAKLVAEIEAELGSGL